MVFTYSQFALGAHHSETFYTTQLGRLDFKLANFSANQNYWHLLAFFNVWRTTNNLQFFFANINLADMQFVRVRMIIDFHYLSNNHLFEVQFNLLNVID